MQRHQKFKQGRTMTKNIIHFFLIIFFICFSMLNAQSSSQKYLDNRIVLGDKRYPSFLLALELLEKVNAKTLVETGTARNGDKNFWGDGGSTILFGEWAYRNEAILHSVDIAKWAIENAQAATIKYAPSIHFTCGDSITFLKNFDQPIDFLYLDSFDFDEHNPKPSQEHHLKEIIAAYPLLHENSIVMVDDCDLPFGGKGLLIIEFLLENGWTIVYQGYQTILMRSKI